MASVKDTASFFVHGNTKQFDFVLKLYPQVLKLKAEKRTKKPEELIKLDDWYQNELPRRIKQRGKDAHLVHEELVQAMKWKQSRGKFYPQLSYLIKVNTPRAVMQETKKAFKKLPNLEQALTALSNLKGVGTTMASALLAAAAPDSAPFMADECLMAIPEIEGIDYTTKEYLNFVQHIQSTVTRLNTEKDNNNTTAWSPHMVELAIWTHYVATELQSDLLEGMPIGLHNPQTNGSQKRSSDSDDASDLVIRPTGSGLDEESVDGPAMMQTLTVSTEQSDESNLEPPLPAVPSNGSKHGNGVIDSLDESTRSEDSLEKPIRLMVPNEESTNETIDSDSQSSSAKRSLGTCESSNSLTELSGPESKKLKSE